MGVRCFNQHIKQKSRIVKITLENRLKWLHVREGHTIISKAKAREIMWNMWLFCQLSTRVFSSATIQKYQFFGAQAFFMVQLSHPYMTTGKTLALPVWTFVEKVMSLLLICCLGLSQLFFQGASVFWSLTWGVYCWIFHRPLRLMWKILRQLDKIRAAARRTNPVSKEWWLRRRRKA